MRKWQIAVFAILVLSFIPITLFSEETQKEGTQVYIIKKGDTLWDISEHFFNNPWLWPKIWERNKYIKNPHWIYPGNSLTLLDLMGETVPPSEEKKAGTEAPATQAEQVPVAVPAPEAQEKEKEKSKTEEAKLEEVPAIDVSGVPGALGTVYYSHAASIGFISKDEIENIGTITDTEKGDEKKFVDPGEIAFINKGAANGVKIGDRFMVIEIQDEVSHPVTGEPAGNKIAELGVLEATEVKDKTSVTKVVKVSREVSQGDKIMPIAPNVVEVELKKKTHDLDGYILQARDIVTQIGEGDVVYIDKGERDGILPGNVFTVYRERAKADEEANQIVDIIGKIVVFRTYPTTSTAIVTKTRREIIIGDKFKSDLF